MRTQTHALSLTHMHVCMHTHTHAVQYHSVLVNGDVESLHCLVIHTVTAKLLLSGKMALWDEGCLCQLPGVLNFCSIIHYMFEVSLE